MTIALHLCKGNYKGHWMAEGGYEAVAEKLFNEADVDTFFLEYESERAGGFEPLRHVPNDKNVDPRPDQLARRRELEPLDAAASAASTRRAGTLRSTGSASARNAALPRASAEIP